MTERRFRFVQIEEHPINNSINWDIFMQMTGGDEIYARPLKIELTDSDYD